MVLFEKLFASRAFICLGVFITFCSFLRRSSSEAKDLVATPFISPSNNLYTSSSALEIRDDQNGSLSQITTHDLASIISVSENGNLYLVPQNGPADVSDVDVSTFFYAADDGTIYSDYSGDNLHIYSGEMTQYGVSRLRLHDITVLPVTSVLIYLTPLLNEATGLATLAGVTTDGNFYLLAACSFEDQETKIFAVADPDGTTSLMSADLKGTIVGDTPDECVLIDLTNGAPGKPED